jgi:hypothetical protein
MRCREWGKAVVVREKKRGSRMSGKGLGSGRVKKNKMIHSVLNDERIEAAMTCSSWSKTRCRSGE